IYTVLKRLQVPDLSIKWPNDILSGTSKVCGILIESKIQGTLIDTSIIGVGLNVNQLNFVNLENASSLRCILGKTFDLDELLIQIVDALKTLFLQKNDKGIGFLWDVYESALFKKGMPMTFENDMAEKFVGSIKGVSGDGKLMIAIDKDSIKSFDLKEVKLLY
ncbi:MAG: biotin--[acetyl-CoA-carboxylase] ligase, partial [Pricia sp.]